MSVSVKNLCLSILLNILFLLFTSFFIFYFVETVFYQSFSMALQFITSCANIGITLINLGIIFMFEGMLLIFINNMSVCFGITALTSYILVIINELKMSARGEAFTLSDIVVAKEALLVAGNYDLKISMVDVNVFFLLCILFLLLFFFKPEKPKTANKKIALKSAFALIYAGVFLILWMNMENVIERFGGNGKYIYVTADFYNRNGYLAGIARTTPHKMKAPAGYSRGTIEAIQNDISNEQRDKTPNIIFVMNESLYDIGMLERVEFNKDPLEKMKKWQEEYAHGDFISPASGGGTCNVEFEVLTGCPLDNVGGSTVLPYSDMIHQDIVSLVSLMNSNGYRTAAFHPNTGTYFNRRQIYDYMGFSEVYFSEEMGELPKEGLYASDLELYKRVIETYEAGKGNGQPFFSYIITMQNHGGYSYEYNKSGIEVVQGGICENESELQTYANIISSSVDAMDYLITYFETVEDPTVIVMFGDHIPSLKSFGYRFDDAENSEQHVYAMTPLVIYNNYSLPDEDWGYVNGYNLAAKVLAYCGIRMDDFFAFALEEDNISTCIVGGGANCYINEQWVPLETAKPEIAEYRKKMWLLAYDRVFGEKYGDWDK